MRTLLGDLGVDFPLKEYAFHQPDHPAEGFKQSTAHLDSTHDINGELPFVSLEHPRLT
jgi:hypothetical protein